jgi:hypothetical protein
MLGGQVQASPPYYCADYCARSLCHKLEEFHAAVLKQRVDFIEYGNPEELSDKGRAKLNCDLKQVLIHRADQLIIATGQMLPAKNLYGMALAARGYIETVAVLLLRQTTVNPV